MNRRDSFEIYWAEQNDVPVETMAQYRCDDERKYRLPKMASRYRVWCAALDSVEIRLPYVHGYPACEASSDQDYYMDEAKSDMRQECKKAIEAAGLKVSN